MAIICGVLLQTSVVQGSNSTKLTLACVLCSLFGIVSGVIALRIKLGFAAKDNSKHMAESKARLGDPQYVEKLRKYGYKV
jgi:hydrogenase-4 membrane subunit HyfE